MIETSTIGSGDKDFEQLFGGGRVVIKADTFTVIKNNSIVANGRPFDLVDCGLLAGKVDN